MIGIQLQPANRSEQQNLFLMRTLTQTSFCSFCTLILLHAIGMTKNTYLFKLSLLKGNNVKKSIYNFELYFINYNQNTKNYLHIKMETLMQLATCGYFQISSLISLNCCRDYNHAQN